MVLKSFLIIIIVVFGAVSITASENKITDDISFILNHRPALQPVESQESPGTNKEISELGLLGTGFIRVYQTLLSSQDRESCNFYPSCSHYAETTMRESGFFKGLMMTADRLSRCHFLARPQRCLFNDTCVLFDRDKLYDPPGNNLSVPNDE